MQDETVQVGRPEPDTELKPARNPTRVVVTFETGDELEITDQDNLRVITSHGSFIKPDLIDIVDGLLEGWIKWLMLVSTDIKVKTQHNEWDSGDEERFIGDVYWPVHRVAEIIVL